VECATEGKIYKNEGTTEESDPTDPEGTVTFQSPAGQTTFTLFQ